MSLDPKWLLYGAIVGGVGYLAYRIAKAAPDAAKAVGQAVDPTSDQNLAYRAANAVTATITGDPNATLGTSIWDLFNSDKNQQIADMLKGGTPAASYDESARLARRYPMPAVLAGPQTELTDPATWELVSTRWGLPL